MEKINLHREQGNLKSLNPSKEINKQIKKNIAALSLLIGFSTSLLGNNTLNIEESKANKDNSILKEKTSEKKIEFIDNAKSLTIRDLNGKALGRLTSQNIKDAIFKPLDQEKIFRKSSSFQGVKVLLNNIEGYVSIHYLKNITPKNLDIIKDENNEIIILIDKNKEKIKNLKHKTNKKEIIYNDTFLNRVDFLLAATIKNTPKGINSELLEYNLIAIKDNYLNGDNLEKIKDKLKIKLNGNFKETRLLEDSISLNIDQLFTKERKRLESGFIQQSNKYIAENFNQFKTSVFHDPLKYSFKITSIGDRAISNYNSVFERITKRLLAKGTIGLFKEYNVASIKELYSKLTNDLIAETLEKISFEKKIILSRLDLFSKQEINKVKKEYNLEGISETTLGEELRTILINFEKNVSNLVLDLKSQIKKKGDLKVLKEIIKQNKFIVEKSDLDEGFDLYLVQEITKLKKQLELEIPNNSFQNLLKIDKLIQAKFIEEQKEKEKVKKFKKYYFNRIKRRLLINSDLINKPQYIQNVENEIGNILSNENPFKAIKKYIKDKNVYFLDVHFASFTTLMIHFTKEVIKQEELKLYNKKEEQLILKVKNETESPKSINQFKGKVLRNIKQDIINTLNYSSSFLSFEKKEILKQRINLFLKLALYSENPHQLFYQKIKILESKNNFDLKLSKINVSEMGLDSLFYNVSKAFRLEIMREDLINKSGEEFIALEKRVGHRSILRAYDFTDNFRQTHLSLNDEYENQILNVIENHPRREELIKLFGSYGNLADYPLKLFSVETRGGLFVKAGKIKNKEGKITNLNNRAMGPIGTLKAYRQRFKVNPVNKESFISSLFTNVLEAFDYSLKDYKTHPNRLEMIYQLHISGAGGVLKAIKSTDPNNFRTYEGFSKQQKEYISKIEKSTNFLKKTGQLDLLSEKIKLNNQLETCKCLELSVKAKEEINNLKDIYTLDNIALKNI